MTRTVLQSIIYLTTVSQVYYCPCKLLKIIDPHCSRIVPRQHKSRFQKGKRNRLSAVRFRALGPLIDLLHCGFNDGPTQI
jgi:hypothetical protein